MPIFEFRAVDSDGKPIQGTLLSSNLSSAAADLERQGLEIQQLQAAMDRDPIARHQPVLQPQAPAFDVTDALDALRPGSTEYAGGVQAQETPRYEVPAGPPTEQRARVMTDVVGPLFNRAPLSQLNFLFRQMHTMLKAGVGMIQTLDTLSGQTRDPRLAAVVRELKGHAEAGRPISVGLQRYPEMFSPMILSIVRVGERAGGLDRACGQIADYLEREIELRNLIRRVTIYPKLVVGASILIIMGANAVIASLGKSGGLDSVLTRLNTWFLLGPLIVGYFLFVRIGLKNPQIKYQVDQFLLGIPMLGPTIRQLAMAKFGRAFGTMYASAVPLKEALLLAADSCGNEYMRYKIYPVAGQLEEGGSIHDAFRNTGVFSPIVLDMLKTGETTGNVEEMLAKVSEFYEDEGRTRSVQFAYAFGVLALLAVGVYVAYTVIQFYSGYFSGTFRQVEEL